MQKAERRMGGIGLLAACLVAAGCTHQVRPTAGDADASRTHAAFGHLIGNDLEAAARHTNAPGSPALSAVVRGLAYLMLAEFASARDAFLQAVESEPRSEAAQLGAIQLHELLHQLPGGHQQARARLTAVLQGSPAPPAELARTLRLILVEDTLRAGEIDRAAAIERDMGIPPSWLVQVPFGRHPLLDLDRDLAPPPGRPAVHLPADGGRLVLRAEPRPGVAWARTWFRPRSGEPLLLRIESSTSWVAYLDGVAVHHHPAHRRVLPRVTWLGLPVSSGWHELLLKIAVRQEEEVLGVELVAAGGTPRAAEFGGRPAAAETERTRRPPAETQPVELARHRLAQRAERNPDDPLAPALAALADWEDGDLARARRGLRQSLARAPDFALPHYLLALILLDDPRVPYRIDMARSRRHLDRAAALCPRMLLARFRTALLESAQGRHTEALGALARLERERPGLFLWPYYRGQAFERLGWDRDADCAYRLALERLPDQPELLAHMFERAVQLHDARTARQLALRLESLGHMSPDVAAFWQTRGQTERARGMLESIIRHHPARLEPRLDLVDLSMRTGALERATTALDEIAKLSPAAPRVLRRRIDLLDLQRRTADADRARRAWQEAMPWNHRARLARLAVTAPGEPIRLRGERRLDAHREIERFRQARDFPRRGNAVLVLDQAAVEMARDGSVLERTHMIVCVLTPEGLEQWGEIGNIPSGAMVDTVRTITADGQIHQAEAFPGKDSFSLPALQVGDFVEIDYLHGRPGDGGAATRRWYFQAPGSAVFHSLYSVAHPVGVDAAVDVHGAVPPVTEWTEDGYRVRRWEQQRAPMVVPEAHAPPIDEQVPFVQVGFGESWRRYRDLLRCALQEAALPGPDLDAYLDEILAGVQGEKNRIEKVFRAVCSHIRQAGPADAFDQPASHVLARREGNRLTLLASLLGILGRQPQVYLARTTSSSREAYRFPNREVFVHGLIAVTLAGGERLWMDPGGRHHAFGVLYPYLRGEKALRVTSPAGSDPFERLPQQRGLALGKHIALRLSLAADGTLRGEGRESMHTAQAARYRALLGSMSPAQRRQVMQTGLGNYFSGAILEEHGIEALDDPERPLVLRYRLRVPEFAPRRNGALVIPGGFYPYRLGPSLITTPERTLPLLIEDETRSNSRVVVELPPGARVQPPAPLDLEAPLSTFSYRVRMEQDLLVIEKSLRVRAGRVSPEDYPAFRDFCAQVDRIDAAEIRVEIP